MSLAAAIRYYRARERERVNVGMASVVTAADFMTGLSPMAAGAYDRKGAMVEAFARQEGETFAAFRERVTEAVHALPLAMRVKLGGLARRPSAGLPDLPEGVPRGAVVLPDIPPHSSQVEALEIIERARRTVMVCGRRWGKSAALVMLAIDYALAGRNVGLFAPTYRFLKPLVDAVVLALGALPGVQVNRTLGEIRLRGRRRDRRMVRRLYRARREGPKISFVFGRRSRT